MKYYIGMGSNSSKNPLKSLNSALKKIRKIPNLSIQKISPIYKTPALLPDKAKNSWDIPFLNAVIEVESQQDPLALLQFLQNAEKEMGRSKDRLRWSPRLIDLDILICKEKAYKEKNLTLPHKEIQKRNFVLAPLRDLNPNLDISGESALKRSQDVASLPMVFDVTNFAADSFSETKNSFGLASLKHKLSSALGFGISVIDIGSESTRPNGKPLSHKKEWEGLKLGLENYWQVFSKENFRPWLSVDTYKFQTAKKAHELGFDILNDVSGLSDLNILDFLQSFKGQYVLTHSLGVPVDPKIHLKTDQDVMIQLKKWFDKKINLLAQKGISSDRLFLDPGIGFGKTPHQNLEILKRFQELQSFGIRILIGHSRKSFMKIFTDKPSSDRDQETLGIALYLAEKGLDALRLHKAQDFLESHLAVSHLIREKALHNQQAK